MKNLIIISICCIVYALSSSCEKVTNFLDKAPGVDITQDTIFSSLTNLETFIAGTYSYGMPTALPGMQWTVNGVIVQNWGGWSYYEAAGDCDEGVASAGTNGLARYTQGIMDPQIALTMLDNRFRVRWAAIRMSNILMVKVDDVPGVDQAYKDQVKGEARFLRAINYFEMLRRYGGVPIVDKAFAVSDNMKIPRSSLKETADFILKDCDYAASVLPDLYPPIYRGRITKGAALMLKAKTLLYLASPLFNTATPYLNMADAANNKMVCLGNLDAGRWQTAADAAKAILDWAPGAGCALITDQGVTKNYKYVWEKTDNAEIILADQQFGTRPDGATSKMGGNYPWCNMLAACFNLSSGGTGLGINFNFITKFYDKTDGTPQTWNYNGGTDLNQKYSQLDNRFKADVLYNGSYFNPAYPIINIYQGGSHAAASLLGHYGRKFIPDNYASKPITKPSIFRLAEAYLMYAEALNEAQGPIQAAYDAVNAIRSRSGMPNLPAGLTKDQFRIRIQKEWAVEFFCEEHRVFDIRRWKIMEDDGVGKGTFYGIKVYNQTAPSTEFTYTPFVSDSRNTQKSNYLWPFDPIEVNKGYLIQNPGY